MIQINNFFFNPVKFKKKPKEIGNTTRSFSGKIHTQVINDYNEFEFRCEGLSPDMLSNLLYLLSLNRGNNPEKLTLKDENGDIYLVEIPIGEFDYDREEGKEETYYWEMEMWEDI